MTPKQLVKSAVVALVVAGAIAVVMIATATPALSPSDRGSTAACRTDVSTVQSAADAFRNNPHTGSPPGSADARGKPGEPPTMAQLVSQGYLHSAPTACASYAIDGATGIVSAVTKDGTAVPSVNPPLMK